MKILCDYLPIVFFYIAYLLSHHNFFVATGVYMITALIMFILYWIKYRRIEKTLLFVTLLVLVMGGLTIWLKDPFYLKWKVSIIYWILASILTLYPFFGKQTLPARYLSKEITLPSEVWMRINIACILFLILIGSINLYITYHYSTVVWVNFKLFGTLGLLLVFCILLSLYISRFQASHDTSCVNDNIISDNDATHTLLENNTHSLHPDTPPPTRAKRHQTIIDCIQSSLQPTQLTIIDESADHIGHAEATSDKGHYKIIIQAKILEALSTLEQHRLIYKTLGSLMDNDIHALSIEIIPASSK